MIRPNEVLQAAETLRKIVEVTNGLPGDSPADARLRDRLEFAADVLKVTAPASVNL